MKTLAQLGKILHLTPPKKKKMRATIARRSLRAATANYEDMAEPNMKLSRALLIVLLLHVVAVSGIIAFNAIKTRQMSSIARPKSSSAAVAGKSNSPTASSLGEPDMARSGEIRTGQAVGKSNPKDRSKPGDAAHRDDSHKTYTVAKGDSPVSIARKFKVSYDELLALNHIDDPRKLKIGQKLLIPNKNVKGKKPDQ